MRIVVFVMLAVSLAAPPALAGAEEDCASNTIELRIKGCSQLINAGKLSPQDLAFAYINRGDALFAHGEHYQAIEDFGKAIDLDPDEAKAYNNRAWAYLTLQRPKEGLPDALKAVEIDAKNADAWDTLGTTYVLMGEKQKAVEALKKANALDPDHKLGTELLAKLEAAKKSE